ncbi:unnamed protein product [Leptosia nina]|uniref:Uncharacterized protein n=1 Tax=Leptosia nina TaxID=320188 RepID=A0AAV1IYA4_9NEOP
MKLSYLITFALVSQARALVELNCSDNATCIDYMAREFVRSIRQQKAVRLFDTFTIEPIGNARQARSKDPLTRLLTSHAISFDWSDFTFKFSNTEDKSDALDLEVYESRTAKDVSDEAPKKSNSKVEEEAPQDKTPKRIRRRHKRKVMQAVIPLLFGMKSAAVAIFSLAVVAVITIKAFLASKLALLVTVGMAAKKLYENYTGGAGLQNHPLLYSQYPIDFPSASSQAYSVSGVQQFGSSEMFSPSGLASQTHTHEILQTNEPSAQQSQQAPSVLVNSTRAAERWDGKSALLKFLEPVVNKIRSFVDPIASVFFDAMPANFRGLKSDVSTAKSVENEVLEEKTKKPREILLPQPRHIAQRKMSYYKKIPRQRPKKYTELNLDLDRLKHNKDFRDYIKTKKYKFNYPYTYYYPRIKYYVNPAMFAVRPNNSRLLPYRRTELRTNMTIEISNVTMIPEPSDWKPIIVYKADDSKAQGNKTESEVKKVLKKKRKRPKRSLDFNNSSNDFQLDGRSKKQKSPFENTISFARDYLNKMIKSALKPKGDTPIYYTLTYHLLMSCLDAFDTFVQIHEDIINFFSKNTKHTKLKKKKTKKGILHSHWSEKVTANDTETHNSTSRVPETSNILWKLARYFRYLFGLAPPPLSAESMPMPLYTLPQNMADQMPMFSPSLTMPANQ